MLQTNPKVCLWGLWSQRLQAPQFFPVCQKTVCLWGFLRKNINSSKPIYPLSSQTFAIFTMYVLCYKQRLEILNGRILYLRKKAINLQVIFKAVFSNSNLKSFLRFASRSRFSSGRRFKLLSLVCKQKLNNFFIISSRGNVEWITRFVFIRVYNKFKSLLQTLIITGCKESPARHYFSMKTRGREKINQKLDKTYSNS